MRDMMKQTLCYWAPGDPDGFGRTEFQPPVVIMCRWQEDQVLARDSQGREFTSNAIAYTDTPVEIASFIALSDAGSGTEDPREVPDAFEVRQVVRTSSLDQDETLWKVIV